MAADTAAAAGVSAGEREAGPLEVVVVGGGIAGLAFALGLAASLRGRKRVRLYDGRWTASSGGGLRWRLDAKERPGATRVVTLPVALLDDFAPAVRERVLRAVGKACQWPPPSAAAGFVGGESEARRNCAVGDLEDALLEAAQECAETLELRAFPCSEEELVGGERFHSIVLADGPDALWLRDGPLCEAFRADASDAGCKTDVRVASKSAREALGIAFCLSPEVVPLNIAECTAIALSQGRYLLSATDERQGFITMRLRASEASEAADLVDMAAERRRGSALWFNVLDGLTLYGIPEEAITSMTLLRSCADSEERPSVSELTSCRAVEGEEGRIPHPFAFLLGESAGAGSLWPGRELDATAAGSASLVRVLGGMQQGRQYGLPMQRSSFEEHEQFMMLLQRREALGMARAKSQASSARGTTARGKMSVASQEAILEALRSSRECLLTCGIASERAEEMRDAEVLCGAVAASLAGMSDTTLAALAGDFAGPWAVATDFSKPATEESPPAVSSEGLEQADDVPEDDDESETPSQLYNRGVRYLRGLDVEKDEAHAAACFLKAAAREHVPAMYAIGTMFLNGKGLVKDKRRAATWLFRAAEQGHAKAQYNLSLMLERGDGIRRDGTLSASWMTQAAQQGHGRALRSDKVEAFGVGPWTDIDVKKLGAEEIRRRAEQGDVNAQVRFALMLYDGECVQVDKAKASCWFMRAAQQGVAEAQYRFAFMLLQGDGVEADEDYGMTFLRQASAQGHADAMFNLGVKMYFGEGTSVDRAQAAALFLRAAEEGLHQAQNNIGYMMIIGESVVQDVEKGCQWLRKATQNGNDVASDTLRRFPFAKGLLLNGKHVSRCLPGAGANKRF